MKRENVKNEIRYQILYKVGRAPAQYLIVIVLFIAGLTSHGISQTVVFGPKSVLLHDLDVEYPDDATVAGDFDGDGDMDLASVSSGILFMFRNRGDLTFDTLDLMNEPSEKVRDVADMNGDGVDDLITSDAFYALDTAQQFVRHALDLGSFRLVRMARDINQDGYADIVAEHNVPGEDPVMYWYRNDAGSGFTQRLIDNEEPDYDYATVADYNKDGLMDIIVVNADQHRFLIFRQGASGGLTRVAVPTSADVMDQGVAIVDADGDGDNDIISGAPLDFTESLYSLENKNLNFSTRHPISGFLYIYSLDTGDLDGDGDEDLVFIEKSGNYRVGYILNQGSNQWDPPVYLGSFNSFGILAYQNINLFDTWLQVVDINQDGKKDILVSAIPNDEVFWYKNQTIFTGTSVPDESPVHVYPQPAVDHVTIANMPFSTAVFQLYTMTGEEVLNAEIQNNGVLPLPALVPGIYQYTVSNAPSHTIYSGKLSISSH